jgi:hypothetical protein
MQDNSFKNILCPLASLFPSALHRQEHAPHHYLALLLSNNSLPHTQLLFASLLQLDVVDSPTFGQTAQLLFTLFLPLLSLLFLFFARVLLCLAVQLYRRPL